jgi:hypothetical protein
MLTSIKFQFISLLNFFFGIYIIILFFIFGYLEIVSESFVVIGLVTIFSQGFSANSRNIYLGSAAVMNLKQLILIRILIGFIGYIVTITLTYKYIGKSNILFHASLIFTIFINWILELILARYEKTNTINIYHFANLFLLLFITFFFVFYKNIFYLSFYLFFNSLTNLLIFKKYFKKILNQKLIFNKWNLGYFSTLLKTIVNFCWKYFIILFLGKINASFLFLGFAFGSFFSTILDISYGSLFLKKIKNKFFFINIIYLIYIFLVFLFVSLIKGSVDYTSYQYDLFISTTIFSICGAYFLVLALIQRQVFFEKENFRVICYKADIIYYLFNFFIVPIIYLFDTQFLIISFFISSIFCYFLYNVFIKNIYSNKNI